MSKKKRLGRPLIGTGATIHMTIYLTERERKVMVRKAKHTGLSFSQIMRAMIMRDQRPCA